MEKGIEELTKFLQNQQILQIAPAAGDPWIANVFMGCETPEKIYFVGNPDTQYGKQLLQDPKLAFAAAWRNDSNHLDRKGIQGVGEAIFTKDEEDIAIGIRLHNQNYPEFAERITVDWVHTNEDGSGVWVIQPTFIKFWNDELYGDEETEEFKFN